MREEKNSKSYLEIKMQLEEQIFKQLKNKLAKYFKTHRSAQTTASDLHKQKYQILNQII